MASSFDGPIFSHQLPGGYFMLTFSVQILVKLAAFYVQAQRKLSLKVCVWALNTKETVALRNVCFSLIFTRAPILNHQAVTAQLFP